MRNIDPALQAHLNSGVTTLCYCWRLTLASGEQMGFTDHDADLAFDGTTFEAQAGFTATEMQSSLGLSVDNLETSGALSSAQISEARIESGDFDDATIEIWTVNWQDPTQRLLERKGNLGEITRGAGAFKAEVRGLAAKLNQQAGRYYQFACDAQLGDARCKVALSPLAATITGQSGATLLVSGLDGFADDWFTRGQVMIGTRKLDIKRHVNAATAAQVDLWEAPKFAIALNTPIQVVPGCDKQMATCQSKFNNIVNFRGFSQMPGNDFVMQVASQSDPNYNGRAIR